MDIAHKIAAETAEAIALLRQVAETIEDDDQARVDTIEGETRLVEAIAAAVKRISEAEGHVVALKQMISDMRARQERFEHISSRLREAVQSAMERTSVRKFEFPNATVSLRMVPPKVEVFDVTALPAAYLMQPPPVPDKTAIKAAIKTGVDVAGARLGNGSQTVSIRFG